MPDQPLRSASPAGSLRGPLPGDGDSTGPLRIFLCAVLGYFALQIVLRLILGGAFETDEAEMLVMTPGYRLGYGPQLPLYNWLQLSLFHLFGRDLFALSLLKNLLLAVTYLSVFAGLRMWMPLRLAVLGTLALFLVPDMAWEAERATTHSNMMLAACGWTLAASGLWLRRRPEKAGWGMAVVLGLALGFGGLSKYNYWIVPVSLCLSALSLAPLRRRLFGWPLILSLLIAAAILWAPMHWIAAQKALALSSADKLQLDLGDRPLAPVKELLSGFLSLLALPLLVVAGVRLAALLQGRRARAELPDRTVTAISWLLRAGVIALILTSAGMMAAGMGTVTSRWLLPVVFLLAPALMLRFLGSLPRAGLPGVSGVVILLAVLVFAGLTYDRFKPGARRDVDFSTLPQILSAVAPLPQTPVAVEFYTAGNLAHLMPQAKIAPLLPFAAARLGQGPVLVILREKTPSSLWIALQQGGWISGRQDMARVTTEAEGSFTLPYMHDDAQMPFRYALVTIAPQG